MDYQYLFGPVPSRRLGVSLGIDLVPLKTCSFNCIFCECGKTTDLTIERKEYFPTETILKELDNYLSKKPELDFITFSGSGEPTLHTGIGRIARHIKSNYPDYKLALLTNGSLLWDKNLRSEVMGIDVIIPSLNAVSEKIFTKINRPHPSLSSAKIINGLIELRKEFMGEIWLEIFIIPGLNDTNEELDLLKSAIHKIRPEKVQLNALDRPGVVDWITVPSYSDMERIRDNLDYHDVEIVSSIYSRAEIPGITGDVTEEILMTIRRRPCTISDLSRICNLRATEVSKNIDILVEKGEITAKKEKRGIFYSCKK